MKTISIKYSNSGLNSPRLILNAVIDIMEGNDPSGIVEVSPENRLEDIQNMLETRLTYKVNAGIMTSRNIKTGKTVEYLQAFIG